MIFTIQFGTKNTKEKLASELLGININSLKELL